MMTEEGAKALRAPFDPASIGKLPRVTCKDCSDRNTNCTKHQKSRCSICGNYISSAHIHLDYVGHAAVTDRLLSVDPDWSWEPVAFDAEGAPLIKRDGREARLWIRLTILGVTRLGVGSAAADSFELDKQLIGDAIRNAAMRFGVALDLWSKEDLGHEDEPAAPPNVDTSTGEIHHPPALTNIDAMKPRELAAALEAHQLEAGGTVAEMRARLHEIAGAGESPTARDEDVVPAPSDSPAADEAYGYGLWPKDDLIAECKDRGLPHSGNAVRLMNELRAWDVVHAPGIPETAERSF